MNTPRFADLGRSPAPQDVKASAHGSATPPDEDETSPGDPPDHEKDDEMSDTVDTNSKDYLAGQAAGETIGFKAANDRMNTVLASVHYAGREAVAAKLLTKGAMSAEDIVDVLAATPKAQPQGADDEVVKQAAEEAARQEMKDAMQGRGNADLGTGSDDTANARAKTDAVWDRARDASSRKGN